MTKTISQTGMRMIGACAAALLAIVLMVAASPADSAWAADSSGSPQVVWQEKGGKYYCKVDGVAQKNGIRHVNGKEFLFDKNGAQLVGWQKVGGGYYYFTPKYQSKGAMVYNKVVNGVRLGNTGRAVLNQQTLAEVKVLVKAQEFVEKFTKPSWSNSKKLRACFNTLVHKYGERTWHGFSHAPGWARIEANDMFTKKAGPCYSHGAAIAYIANAIGYAKCKVVSSGGHGWGEIDGLVYDPEWSKHFRPDVYGANGTYRSTSGRLQDYKHNSIYVVTIQPRSTEIKGAKLPGSQKSSKNGLVKKGSNLYFFTDGKMTKSTWKNVGKSRYYFTSSGKAAKATSLKIKGVYHVFREDGKLALGSATRVVTIGDAKYQVTKAGKAKSGWDASHERYFGANGRMLVGDCLMDGKLAAFSNAGVYNAERTSALRAAAVMEQDASVLLELLGKPSKTTYVPSCNIIIGPDGAEIEGEDGILEYPRFTLYTFRGTDGIERYMGVKAK